MAAKKKFNKTNTNKFALTPIKRSHLVSTSGVGSLIRLRNGATALVAGLQTWVDTIPVPRDENADEARTAYLKKYLIRDAELESATRVARFYQPPMAGSDENKVSTYEWQIPAIVFPRSSICETRTCGSVKLDMMDTGTRPECAKCAEANQDKKRKRKKKQSPIFLICSRGHIDDIDWTNAVTHTANCVNPDMRVRTSTSVHTPTVECKNCEAKQKLSKTHECTGARPWLPGKPAEQCSNKMIVIDRTSVLVYFHQSKSSIHVPPKSGLDPDILDWILVNYPDLRFISPDNDEHVTAVRDDLHAVGKILDSDATRKHIAHLKGVFDSSNVTEEWDKLEARAHELDVFTGRRTDFVVGDSHFLEFRTSDTSALDPQFFGNIGLFSQVVSLTRLTETRVHDGFGRFTPNSVPQIDGFERMWGHKNHKNSWLPAYRAYGEGILFVINPAIANRWASTGRFIDPTHDQDDPDKLSYLGVLAHSMAHLVMVELSQQCGYPLPAIQDRIYDLPDGRTAFLVYTADSDIMGTLGGLVAFGEGEKLQDLVRASLKNAQWCSQDPVCIGRVLNENHRQAACCHQCLLLPETSCESFNRYLDRATIVGSTERNVKGITEFLS